MDVTTAGQAVVSGDVGLTTEAMGFFQSQDCKAPIEKQKLLASGREVRIRVPEFVSAVYFSRGQKKGNRALLRKPSCKRVPDLMDQDLCPR